MENEKEVILLTFNFPYSSGEAFIQDEVDVWASSYPGRLTILPTNASGDRRHVPDNVIVDTSFAKESRLLERWVNYVRSFFSPLFLREVLFLIKQYNFKHLKCFYIAYTTTYLTLLQYRRLRTFLKGKKGDILIYSYWYDISAYAIALLRKRKEIKTAISRAHGFDVYEDRRPYGYMPLKRQFTGCLDQVLALSGKGKEYLADTYQIPDSKISVHRLGVMIPDDICRSNPDDVFVICSVSYCIPVKRIDKIIEGISLFSRNRENMQIHWHHIGSGPELKRLCSLADARLKDTRVSWTFHGEMTNSEVMGFLRNTPIDVFLNTSDSEGVPVSIMEAMSYGIPAIAPDIGGISDLITESNGALMRASPSIQDVAAALSRIGHFKDPAVRENARIHIQKNYNAIQNYSMLISFVQAF